MLVDAGDDEVPVHRRRGRRQPHRARQLGPRPGAARSAGQRRHPARPLLRLSAPTCRSIPSSRRIFREHQPPTLIVWGKNDKIFPADGAHPYKRDLPDVEFHLLDTGHFALEDKARRDGAADPRLSGPQGLGMNPPPGRGRCRASLSERAVKNRCSPSSRSPPPWARPALWRRPRGTSAGRPGLAAVTEGRRRGSSSTRPCRSGWRAGWWIQYRAENLRIVQVFGPTRSMSPRDRARPRDGGRRALALGRRERRADHTELGCRTSQSVVSSAHPTHKIIDHGAVTLHHPGPEVSRNYCCLTGALQTN